MSVAIPSPHRTSPLRRHLRWIIPLVTAPVLFMAGLLAVSALQSDQENAALLLLSVVALAVAFLGPIAALIVALIGGIRTVSEWRKVRRHTRGQYTPEELRQQQRQTALNGAWANARQLRRELIRQEAPRTIAVWDVVPNRNELFFMDFPVSYSRFYGQDVTYSVSGGFFFGHPAFVVAGLGLTALGNAARKSQAESVARTQWRDNQPTRLLVSNQRFVCMIGGRWLSFYFGGMTAVYPEVSDWTLICQFDDTSPLLLHGPNVPAASLIAMLMTHGSEGLQHHPSLEPLG